jgi:hypothetical protein
MFSKKEQEELIIMLRLKIQEQWNIIGFKSDETPYIEFLNDLLSKVEDMDCPECLLCNDTGEVEVSTEVDGRDIDNIIRCSCTK